VVHRYKKMKEMSGKDLELCVPRVVIFGGKAAPGYYIAKLVIKLINSVAKVINTDRDVAGLLSVVFMPDYNVSQAEILVTASDISQHISTAGTEASGTSNMKFVLNGGVILGTVDGANIEIAEEIGEENIFLFGLTADKVPEARHEQTYGKLPLNKDLKEVVDWIQTGVFGDPAIFSPVLDTITTPGGDYYLISQDFGAYLDTQRKVDTAFLDPMAWAKMSVKCTARMAKFSSDRAVREYASMIWDATPCPVGTENPLPGKAHVEEGELSNGESGVFIAVAEPLSI